VSPDNEAELVTDLATLEKSKRLRRRQPAQIQDDPADDPAAQLASLEDIIARGVNACFEAGDALSEIRDRRLYRQRFQSFEEYLAKHWQMSRRRAYELISAAQVRRTLCAIAHTGLLPDHESQVRPLASLVPAKQQLAWRTATEISAGQQPTAAQVRRAVQMQNPKSPAEQTRTPFHEEVERSFTKWMTSFDANDQMLVRKIVKKIL
jgi:hypothetical protein